MNWLRPKWKHSKVKVRTAAVEKLTDQRLLAKIARTDNYEDVRLTAVKKLEDATVLVEIARTDESKYIRREALSKIADQALLAEIAKIDKDDDVQQAAIEKIDNQDLLAEIAGAECAFYARRLALKKLTDQPALKRIAETDRDRFVRLNAVSQITDQKTLADIARNDPESMVRERAAEKLTDQQSLQNIASTDQVPEVRKAALKKIDNHALLSEIARNDKNLHVRKAAINLLTQDDLAAAALAGKAGEPLRQIVEALNEPALLLNIAAEAEDPAVCRDALDRLCQYHLVKVARNASRAEIRLAAVERLADPEDLGIISRSDEDDRVRAAASSRAQSQEEVWKRAETPEVWLELLPKTPFIPRYLVAETAPQAAWDPDLCGGPDDILWVIGRLQKLSRRKDGDKTGYWTNLTVRCCPDHSREFLRLELVKYFPDSSRSEYSFNIYAARIDFGVWFVGAFQQIEPRKILKIVSP